MMDPDYRRDDWGNAPPPAPPTSSLAITSLVSGILGWTVLPVIASLVAIITGHLALGEIGRSAGRLKGKGLATAGLVLGYISMALSILAVVIITAAMVFLYGVAQTSTIQTLPPTAASPAVDDALKQLPPDASVELKVRTIVAAQSGRPVESLTAGTTLDSLEIDELDRVELVMELEEVFAITIEDEEADAFKSIGDVIRLIQEKLPTQAGGAAVPAGAGAGPAAVP